MNRTDDPLPELIRLLRGRLPTDRLRAAKSLGRLGWLAREALAPLMLALNDEEAKVRESAAYAVGQMGPDALPALRTMLAHDDKYVRRNAVWAMGKLGPLARVALSELCKSLKDSDPRTASGAAQALGSMGADAADAVPALAEAMRGTNIVLCRLAAKALSQVGPPALATLIAHLQHADPFVRGESALALGWMGPVARSSVPFLAQVVRGPCITPRTRSASALSDSSSATPPVQNLTAVAGSADETSRVYAAQALGRIGPSASGALSDLLMVQSTGHDALRLAAEHAIRLIQA